VAIVPTNVKVDIASVGNLDKLNLPKHICLIILFCNFNDENSPDEKYVAAKGEVNFITEISFCKVFELYLECTKYVVVVATILLLTYV